MTDQETDDLRAEIWNVLASVKIIPPATQELLAGALLELFEKWDGRAHKVEIKKCLLRK